MVLTPWPLSHKRYLAFEEEAGAPPSPPAAAPGRGSGRGSGGRHSRHSWQVGRGSGGRHSRHSRQGVVANRGMQIAPSLAILASILALAALLALATPPPAAAEPPPASAVARPGEVSLPLKDYLALAESAERAEQTRAAARLHREAPFAEVVAQRLAVELDDLEGEARLVSELEVLVQGHPPSPLALPLAGVPVSVEVSPLAAGSAAGTAAATVDGGGGAAGGGLQLVATAPGRYLVRAGSRARLAGVQGESRLTLARIVGPVAVLEIGLPAGLTWDCPGAVMVDERIEGGRRHLRLSVARGMQPVLAVRRRVEGDEAAALLVQDVVTTILQLRPDGLRRHDVVLYEVTRGALADLEVELPPGLEVERAGTDEGEVQPIVEGVRLVVHRQRRLRGTGYLVLTSRPAAAAGALPLGVITPTPMPRARYLAAATTVPGGIEPRPAASWARVDPGDLPPALAGALQELDVTATWRLVQQESTASAANGAGAANAAGAGGASGAGAGGASGAGAAKGAGAGAGAALTVEVVSAPQAAALETVVRRRLTTTLLTVDGTLVHQDRFELAQAGEALALVLPAGATLWSAAVDGEPVRPLLRGAAGGNLAVPVGGNLAVPVGGNLAVPVGGNLAVPVGGNLAVPLGGNLVVPLGGNLVVPLGGGGARLVEVVAVLEQATAKGRSQLAFELAQVQAPVLEHRWRLLLPENARYRFRAGDLRPAPEALVRAASRPQAAPPPGARDVDAAREQAVAPGSRDPWQVLQNAPGALADRVNLGGNLGGQQASYAGPAPPGLRGKTTDSTGASLPGATITVSAPELPSPLVQVSNANGEFTFSGLAPGTYQLHAQLPGFSPVQYPGIRVATKDHGVQLEVALATAVEDVITTTSESPLLDEKAIRTGNTLSTGELKKIPTARDPGVALDDLRQGLVGGVRPLPVAIPQTGKALLLAGVLPPARVAVELEVRPGAR